MSEFDKTSRDYMNPLVRAFAETMRTGRPVTLTAAEQEQLSAELDEQMRLWREARDYEKAAHQRTMDFYIKQGSATSAASPIKAVTVTAPDGSPVAAPCAISGCQYTATSPERDRDDLYEVFRRMQQRPGEIYTDKSPKLVDRLRFFSTWGRACIWLNGEEFAQLTAAISSERRTLSDVELLDLFQSRATQKHGLRAVFEAGDTNGYVRARDDHVAMAQAVKEIAPRSATQEQFAQSLAHHDAILERCAQIIEARAWLGQGNAAGAIRALKSAKAEGRDA